MKIFLKVTKKLGRFYWNCVEIPRQDFESRLPNLSGLFNLIFFCLTMGAVNAISIFLENIHPFLNTIFSYLFLLPVCLVLFYRILKDK